MPVLQQDSTHSTGSVTTLSLAFPGDVSSGNVLMVAAGVWYTGDVTDPPTDDQGNTYILRNANGNKVGFWTATASTTGPNTVTITPQASSNFLAVGIAELTAGSTNLGAGNFKGVSGTEHITSTGVAPTPNGVAFAMLTCQGNPSGTLTVGSPWSVIKQSTNFSFLPYSFVTRDAASSGAYAATFTLGASITTYTSLLTLSPDAPAPGRGGYPAWQAAPTVAVSGGA